MNPKMKSAIEKITLNDATFSNEVIEPTYVNFFYGKNGAGKSTIARTFKASLIWKRRLLVLSMLKRQKLVAAFLMC